MNGWPQRAKSDHDKRGDRGCGRKGLLPGGSTGRVCPSVRAALSISNHEAKVEPVIFKFI